MASEADERRERAARLRQQIADLTSPSAGEANPPEADASEKPGESEAAYVQRRMRDLNKKKTAGS